MVEYIQRIAHTVRVLLRFVICLPISIGATSSECPVISEETLNDISSSIILAQYELAIWPQQNKA